MTNATYQPQNMLVTGGAGFIGANFIHYMLAQQPNLNIINLDKLTYAGNLDNLEPVKDHPNHHFIQGDICDEKLIAHLLQHHHIDTIVHFAAESHVDRSISSPIDFVRTNVLGTFSLLDAAKHYWFELAKRDPATCRFHHISTDEVYGSLQLDDPAFSETTAYDPRSPYSASKAGSDHLAMAYYHTYGLPVTMSNCSNNYGPYQHSEKLIPTIIHACLNEKTIPIYGNGKNIRDWLYVTDHCSAIHTILQHGKLGETYNIGGRNEWDNLSIAKLICQQFDKIQPGSNPYEHLIEFVTDRPGHDFRYAIDDHKIQTDLNWQPQQSMEAGITKTIEFYLKQKKFRA